MAIKELHLGDVGTIIRVTVMEDGEVVPIDSATVKKIKFTKPSGTIVLKDAEFTTDGTDGKLQYITLANDLDELEVWEARPYVELTAWKGHGTKFSFRVNAVE